jgi:hypothetical protein
MRECNVLTRNQVTDPSAINVGQLLCVAPYTMLGEAAARIGATMMANASV